MDACERGGTGRPFNMDSMVALWLAMDVSGDRHSPHLPIVFKDTPNKKLHLALETEPRTEACTK